MLDKMWCFFVDRTWRNVWLIWTGFLGFGDAKNVTRF
jgi:hypothetical protein